MALLWGSVPAIVDAAVQFGLAGFLVAVGFHRRDNRAFALLLVLTAFSNLLPALGDVVGDAATTGFFAQLNAYALLAWPFAVLHFMMVYPRRRRWMPRAPWTSVPLLVALGAVEGLYLLDHALFWGVPGQRGPLTYLGRFLAPTTLALAAYVFARDHARGARDGADPALLVSFAFALEAVSSSMHFLTGRLFFGFGGTSWVSHRVFDAAVLTSLVLVAAAALHLLRHPPAPPAPHARRHVAGYAGGLVLVGAVMAALALADAASPAEFSRVTAFNNGAVDLVFVGLITYALARHHLFGVELHVKWSIKQSTVVAAVVVLYVAVTQATQAWAPGAAAYIGLGAVVLLVPAVAPLQRVGARLADAALPGVEATPRYLDARKLEVYRVALARALAEDGALPDHEAAMLVSLRAKLGVTDRDHAVLEHAARAARLGGAHRVALVSGTVLLDRYRIDRLLGEGGMGRTYLAEDQQQGGSVVIKAVRPDRDGVEDMLREARAIARLDHPNVVRLHAVERSGEEAFLVMEHVDGGSLADRLGRGPLPPAEFRAVAFDLLQALEAVHRAGLVHRDVKPSNVLITNGGRAKLGDFGVAHLPGLETTIGGNGQAVGTVRFMSPEQARGRRATPRSDLFSAGATLYEAYTGRALLEAKPAETALELQIRAAQAGSFRRPIQGPEALRAWFAKALDPEPGRRFASGEEMARALRAALDGPAASAGRSSARAGAGVPS